MWLPKGASQDRMHPGELIVSALIDLDWREVRRHYDEREDIHHELTRLFRSDDVHNFVRLLLGISDRAGNYSANEHQLGPRILNNNTNGEGRVFDLAGKLINVESASMVPPLIRQAAINYLKIGVGSEASCMLNPRVCWVANTRTIWTHLVIKHADNFNKADEELKLYRDHNDSSEMAYRIWVAIHRELAVSMMRIASEGERLATKASVKPGKTKYIWADAISNALYSSYYE